MRTKLLLFAVTLADGCLSASAVSAASVTFKLSLGGAPGTFTVSASTSAGDNAGLASYSIPLSGSVLTLDHRAPYVINAANFAPAGFSLFRSPDITQATLNPTISGAQDVVNAR